MGGDFGGFADIGSFGDIVFDAADLGSVVTDFGTEFMSSDLLTSFEVPSFDVSALGGFDIVGSFAGDASWFDTFNSGSILSSIPSVSDFSLPTSVTSLVSKTLSNPAVISAGASALGINPAIASTAVKTLGGQGLNVGTAASAFGINPAIVSSATKGISLASNVDAYGLNILNTPQTDQLAKNVNPAFINGLTDTNASSLDRQLAAVNAAQVANGGPDATAASNDPAVQEEIRRIQQATGQIPQNTEPQTLEEQLLAVNAAQVANGGPDATAASNDPAIQEEIRRIEEATGQRPTNFEPQTLEEQLLAVNAEQVANGGPDATAASNDPTVQEEIRRIQQATGQIPQNKIVSDASTTIPGQVVDQYSVIKDTNGTYSILDNATGGTVQSGLSEQQAILETQNLNISTPGISVNNNTTVSTASNIITNITGAVVNTGDGAGTNARSLVDQARNQNAIRALRQTKAQSSDWRVRLKLAPNSTYLYNDPKPGSILAPLRVTDGVIFPYTPIIETAYKANYTPYDLTHSNYRGYFYQNSYVDAVNLRCTFTAQDTEEANYLLAVIHFFRSVTKMFYGQDAQRGSPPPLVYLSGLGDYQFQEHPCLVSQFNYTLPSDVDYIRAGSSIDNGTNFLSNRTRTTIASNPLSFAVNRLLNNALTKGAESSNIAPGNLPVGTPTYVPTRIEISLSLFPVQSRQQVSTQFSLKSFANGNLLKGGFW